MLGILFSKHKWHHPGKKTILACWMRNYLVLSFLIFTWILHIFPLPNMRLDPWFSPNWIHLRRLLFGHFSSLMSSGCCWLQLNVFEPSNWSFLVQKRIQKRTELSRLHTYIQFDILYLQYIPSRERSHIPSLSALLSRWFSQLPVWVGYVMLVP